MNLKTIKRIRGSTHPEVEQALFLWFLNERKQNKLLTQSILQIKMMEFHSLLCEKNACNFKCSTTVIELFQKRHRIRYLTHSGEKLSSKIDGIPDFIDELIKKLESKKFTLENLYNADDSGFQFKETPSRILVASKERTAPNKKALKERFMFLPCCNVTETCRLPLQIIG
uniref:CSON006367 protein n=1 Tax=Culicoides sonorensis TaxID=179676 RepID=A0A336LJF0_CULSO